MTDRFVWQTWTAPDRGALVARTHVATPPAVSAPHRHPTFDRLLEKLPPSVRASLTHEQLSGLAEALRPPPSRHAIQYRVSLPWLGSRFYVAVFAGRDRRSLERIAREGQRSPRAISIAALIGMTLLAGVATLAAIIGLYLIKSALGINLFEGPSILHSYFYHR